VIPLLTTGSGFARYRMSDVLRVEAPLGEVPCFTFLGRNDGVDLVGEKTSAQTAQAVQDGLRLESALPVTLLALDEAARRQPGYVLLVECDATRARGPLERDLARQVEAALQANFHYKLARELGQLQPAACVALPDMRALYLDQCRERGMIEGNIKIEPLRHWTARPRACCVTPWTAARCPLPDSPRLSFSKQFPWPFPSASAPRPTTRASRT